MSARSRAKNQLPAVPEEDPGVAAKVLSQIIERGARVQGPAVKAYVDRLREHNPNATPAEIVGKLDKQYVATVMASGPGSRNVAEFISEPSRIRDVSRARPASVIHASLGPGSPSVPIPR